MPRAYIRDGAVIDGFRIGEKIHTGGMATVWRATRGDIDQPIVMKIPNIEESDDATVIVGFEMEMMILPRLTGVHVPKYYAVGDFARLPYLVMEEIRGHNVFSLIEKAPLPPSEVASLGRRIAAALVDLHRQNVLHLDIKPSNVMIRDSGEAAFIDFGLSRHLLLPDLLEEEFQVPMGTGPYIAPEQIMKNRSDRRSDIFSLGVLLYYLATNVRPFGLPHAQSQLRRRIWRDPVPPRKLAPDMPPWLQEVILKCLEVDPADRYETAKQLAFDFVNPGQVALTERAGRMERNSYFHALRKRFTSRPADDKRFQSRQSHLNLAPIIMAAIDFEPGSDLLGEELRSYVKRLLAISPGVRLACVNVLKLNLLTINPTFDEEGRSIHVQRLVELKEWARPLGLAPERLTFHVLEHMDAAVALIDYARMNHVDQLLIGARATPTYRRFLGNVSGRVVAEAPCTVTVVRAPNVGVIDDFTEAAEAGAGQPTTQSNAT